MTAFQFLKKLRDELHCLPLSKERGKLSKPSNKELKRWFKNGCVQANAELLAADEEMDFEIISFVLFPNSERSRCSLF